MRKHGQPSPNLATELRLAQNEDEVVKCQDLSDFLIRCDLEWSNFIIVINYLFDLSSKLAFLILRVFLHICAIVWRNVTLFQVKYLMINCRYCSMWLTLHVVVFRLTPRFPIQISSSCMSKVTALTPNRSPPSTRTEPTFWNSPRDWDPYPLSSPPPPTWPFSSSPP